MLTERLARRESAPRVTDLAPLDALLAPGGQLDGGVLRRMCPSSAVAGCVVFALPFVRDASHPGAGILSFAFFWFSPSSPLPWPVVRAPRQSPGFAPVSVNVCFPDLSRGEPVKHTRETASVPAQRPRASCLARCHQSLQLLLGPVWCLPWARLTSAPLAPTRSFRHADLPAAPGPQLLCPAPARTPTSALCFLLLGSAPGLCSRVPSETWLHSMITTHLSTV